MNYIEIVFLNFAFSVVLAGFLINHFEKYVPKIIVHTYLYGCFAKNEQLPIVQKFQVPKSYFRHFYIFSTTFSCASLLYMCFVFFVSKEVNIYVTLFLNFFVQEKKPAVCIVAALLAMSCLTFQCLRRFYETRFMQVFAKESKMNITHYIVGILHYFGCITTIMGHAPYFATLPKDGTKVWWIDLYTIIVSVPCLLLFIKAWYEQYQSNLIFSKLRRDDKTNQVLTEEHRIPYGRWFEIVSSPHRLTEILLYTSLFIWIPTRTFACIYLWVIGNQTQTALQAQWWYQSKFKHYPKTRYVIIPGVF